MFSRSTFIDRLASELAQKQLPGEFRDYFLQMSSEKLMAFDKLRHADLTAHENSPARYIFIKLLGIFANLCHKADDTLREKFHSRWFFLCRVLRCGYMDKLRDEKWWFQRVCHNSDLSPGGNGDTCEVELFGCLNRLREQDRKKISDQAIDYFFQLMCDRNMTEKMQRPFVEISDEPSRREKYVFLMFTMNPEHVYQHESYSEFYRSCLLSQSKSSHYFTAELDALLLPKFRSNGQTIRAYKQFNPVRFLKELSPKDVSSLLWRISYLSHGLGVVRTLCCLVGGRATYAALADDNSPRHAGGKSLFNLFHSHNETAYIFMALVQSYTYLLTRFKESDDPLSDFDLSVRMQLFAPLFWLIQQAFLQQQPAGGILPESDVIDVLQTYIQYLGDHPELLDNIEPEDRADEVTSRIVYLMQRSGSIFLSSGVSEFYKYLQEALEGELEFSLALRQCYINHQEEWEQRVAGLLENLVPHDEMALSEEEYLAALCRDYYDKLEQEMAQKNQAHAASDSAMVADSVAEAGPTQQSQAAPGELVEAKERQYQQFKNGLGVCLDKMGSVRESCVSAFLCEAIRLDILLIEFPEVPLRAILQRCSTKVLSAYVRKKLEPEECREQRGVSTQFQDMPKASIYELAKFVTGKPLTRLLHQVSFHFPEAPLNMVDKEFAWKLCFYLMEYFSYILCDRNLFQVRNVELFSLAYLYQHLARLHIEVEHPNFPKTYRAGALMEFLQLNHGAIRSTRGSFREIQIWFMAFVNVQEQRYPQLRDCFLWFKGLCNGPALSLPSNSGMFDGVAKWFGDLWADPPEEARNLNVVQHCAEEGEEKTRVEMRGR